MLWILAGVGILTIFIFSHVDDWSRDLTTNTASTDEASEALKPLRVAQPPAAVNRDLLRVVESMPNWTLAPEADSAMADEHSVAGALKIHLVRTTPIMRFKDDIWVTLIPGEAAGTTVVQVHSQSRLGRGDLGQNPRNIKELLKRLGAAKSTEGQ